MKVRLLFRARDFDWGAEPPWNEQALKTDLAIDTVLAAMAGSDPHILEAATKVMFAGVAGDAETVAYRQAVLRDGLKNRAVLRELYALAVEASDKARKGYLGTLARYPHWVLSDAIEQMDNFLLYLRRLRAIADRHAGKFAAEGWTELFARLRRDLDDAYLAEVAAHLEQLTLRGAIRLSAGLGPGNRPADYVLHQPPPHSWKSKWAFLWQWLFPPKAPPNSFALHPRDEAGHRALSQIRDRGIADAATALAQAKEQVRAFFVTLCSELAFYAGCVNLHDALTAKGEPVCFPEALSAAAPALSCRGLYDVGLALSMAKKTVGNDIAAEGKSLIVVTGANQGGKSTFLRSAGLAQLMMQAGLFAPAKEFRASVAGGIFTHYKREEDASMTRGKFDEELARMSEIVDHIAPHALMLFNEPFAATNEREGSEIGRQVITALLEKSIRVICVTHLHELAHGFYVQKRADALFLRADRQAGGARSFKLSEGEPLPTSFGEDLYNTIFKLPGDH